MGQPAIYLSDAKEGGLERGLADGAEEAPPLLCWRVPSILPIAKWMLICAGMIFGIGVVWDSGFDIPGCKVCYGVFWVFNKKIGFGMLIYSTVLWRRCWS